MNPSIKTFGPFQSLFSSTFPHVSQKQTRQRGSSGAASLLGGKLRAIGITTTNWAGETPSELLGINWKGHVICQAEWEYHVLACCLSDDTVFPEMSGLA